MVREIYGGVLNAIAKNEVGSGKELAERLGVSEATVSRALRALKKSGLLGVNKQGKFFLSEKPAVALADTERNGIRLYVFSFDGKLLRERFIPFPEEMSKEDGIRSAMGDVAISATEHLGVIAPRWSVSQWRAVGAEEVVSDQEISKLYNSVTGGVNILVRSCKEGFAIDVLCDGKLINSSSDKIFSSDEVGEAVSLLLDCLSPGDIMLFFDGDDEIKKKICGVAAKRNIFVMDFYSHDRSAVMEMFLEIFRYRIAADNR